MGSCPGNQRLRCRAGETSVEAHGVLLVTDQLAEHSVMSQGHRADVLEQPVQDRLVFLSNDEVRARIELWRR